MFTCALWVRRVRCFTFQGVQLSLSTLIQKRKTSLHGFWNWTTLFKTSVQSLVNVDICDLLHIGDWQVTDALHGEGFKYIVFLSERVNVVIFYWFYFWREEKKNSVNINIHFFVFCGRKIHCLAWIFIWNKVFRFYDLILCSAASFWFYITWYF